jgi:heme/copper-type cytochrome/quinol oxidase subunit 2
MTLTTLQTDPTIVNWLVQQAPVVVVMGVIIWYLAKKLNKAESDKDEMAKDVIKLTVLWEEKSDKLDDKATKQNEKSNTDNQIIIELLREIKILLNNTKE